MLQGRFEGCEAAPLLVFSKAHLTLEGLYIQTGTHWKTQTLWAVVREASGSELASSVSLWRTTLACAVKKLLGVTETASLLHKHLLENFFRYMN